MYTQVCYVVIRAIRAIRAWLDSHEQLGIDCSGFVKTTP